MYTGRCRGEEKGRFRHDEYQQEAVGQDRKKTDMKVYGERKECGGRLTRSFWGEGKKGLAEEDEKCKDKEINSEVKEAGKLTPY